MFATLVEQPIEESDMGSQFIEQSREQETIAMAICAAHGECEVAMHRTRQMGDTMLVRCADGSALYAADGRLVSGARLMTLEEAIGA